VSAFLGGRQLILKCTAAAPARNQGLGQLERIEIAAETGFGVGDDGDQPVDRGLAVHVMNLVGAQQCVMMRSTIFGTESTGYRLWSGYTSPAVLASPATCQPEQ